MKNLICKLLRLVREEQHLLVITTLGETNAILQAAKNETQAFKAQVERLSADKQNLIQELQQKTILLRDLISGVERMSHRLPPMIELERAKRNLE